MKQVSLMFFITHVANLLVEVATRMRAGEDLGDISVVHALRVHELAVLFSQDGGSEAEAVEFIQALLKNARSEKLPAGCKERFADLTGWCWPSDDGIEVSLTPSLPVISVITA